MHGFPLANLKSFDLLQKIYKTLTINNISTKYTQYFFARTVRAEANF